MVIKTTSSKQCSSEGWTRWVIFRDIGKISAAAQQQTVSAQNYAYLTSNQVVRKSDQIYVSRFDEDLFIC